MSNEAAAEHERRSEEAASNPQARYFEIDPITRATNQISLRAIIDFENRQVLDARVEKTNLWGFDFILIGRAPVDAVHIASRVSGWSAGGNAIAAAMALEMAMGIAPPPLAIITRCLGAAAELLAAHTRHLFVLAGPDYSEAILSRTSMTAWAKAQQAKAEGVAFHGYQTIADIMREMNPVSGYLYREALSLTRTACEVATLVFGKYPHPSSIFPGGVGIEANREIFNQVLGRINRLIDYAKKVTAIWDDLVNFFYRVDARYRRAGELSTNLLSAGMWDDPTSYNARFDSCNVWSEKRLTTPGVIINGKLRTIRLTELNAGIEDFSDRAFYEKGDAGQITLDPLGVPLSPLHPWNKQAIPAPGRSHWQGRYTWSTAPRWAREPMETGPLARQWISAVGGKLKSEFIQAFQNGHDGIGLEIDLPRFQLPARRLRWRIPERPNALDRNRARAYHIGFSGVVALTYLLRAFDCIQRSETAMSTRYRVPDEAIGAGFWEDGQGALTHHAVIAKGRIANYQIVTPSAWMGSPLDPFGRPGPYEQAIINTPLLEEFREPEDFTGIDLLRAIRSFDP
ncbi:MAG: nickel-dependent hydrogenase large subunit [Acidobacteria bacterium]|nr:nickel-dependent hydrogenase large subunit [Acidobacteriota bacterium]